VRAPDAWLARVESAGSGELPRERISAKDQAIEYLMMSLRLAEGMSKLRFSRLAGRWFGRETVGELVALGCISETEDRLIATSAGRLLLNAVIRRLAQDLD
jgi:oxygen-independent coproporphyrinogen-3 oxidase